MGKLGCGRESTTGVCERDRRAASRRVFRGRVVAGVLRWEMWRLVRLFSGEESRGMGNIFGLVVVPGLGVPSILSSMGCTDNRKVDLSVLLVAARVQGLVRP